VPYPCQANEQAQAKEPTPDAEVEEKEDDTETSPTASPPITKKKPILAPGAPKKLPAKKVNLATVAAPKKVIAIGAGSKKGGFKGLLPKASTAQVEKKAGNVKKVEAKVVEKNKVSVAVKAEEEEEDGSEQDEEEAGSDEE
jgi:hypothetical protein